MDQMTWRLSLAFGERADQPAEAEVEESQGRGRGKGKEDFTEIDTPLVR